ncbi:pyridoxal phosphate-dependent aminotransferase [Streptomyces apocyni]|uniref:pyridoxal phosphate-dependent aminotransferase n=1 Tax=Streptomyces apocyni TaxID=2654677 RepID=UPI0018D19EBE|nr:pyridoxal phosphate-dependent aminotransferase [Streptomyces apocyni]
MALRHSTLVDSLSEAASIKQNNRVYDLRADGADVITLSLGEAFFDIPTPSFDELGPAAHHYSHSRGVPLLRQKLAKYHEEGSGTPVDPDREIMITAGSKAAVFMALTALVEPGDEVIVPEPLWVSYPDQVRLCRGIPVTVPWGGTVEDIAARVTPRTRAVVINNPHNPTGRRLTAAELRRLHELADEHGLALIADEVYSEFVPDHEPFVSTGAFDPDREHTVICNSMSKNFGISGWRVGYLIAGEGLIEQVTKLQQHLVTCAPTILCQYLAENFEAVLASTRPQIHAMVERRGRVAAALAARGVECLPGDSTFYLFASLGRSSLGSTEFAEELLSRYRVSVVAGAAYGASCEGFIRVSIGAEPEDRLLRGVRAICDLIDETSTGAVR